MSDGRPCSGCAQLSGRIGEFEGALHALAGVVRGLEAEMYGTTRAVEGVNRSIQVLQAETLASMLTLAQELGVIDQSVNRVDEDVQRVSSSIAHSEIVKAVSDAGSQTQRIGSAQADLLEHFEKSLARIANSQLKFDRIDVELLEAYERDIRRLGQEIFDIWDRDFRQPVRGRLTSGARYHLDRARQALQQIRGARREALDNRLEEGFEQLTTFVSRRRQFEQDLRQYVTSSEVPGGADLAIEALVFETKEPNGDTNVEISMGEQFERSESGSDTVRYGMKASSHFSGLSKDIDAAVRAGTVTIEWRDLSHTEQDAIATEFDAMAGEGLITAEYAGQLKEYLRLHPPAIAAKAGLVSPLPAA